MEEPDADEMINTGIFKHLSGNDSFYARDLFERGKDGREIKPMFKLIFVCNRLPKIKAADKAVWNRVRVIPFESTFCRPDNPAPDTYEEQMAQKRFPMDKQLSKKIPTIVEALAWLLIQHRIDILDKPRIEPEKVRDATNNYRRENDIYRQFEEDMIIEDRNASITLTEVYNLFKDWYRESLPGHTVPAKNDVCEFLSKTWGVPDPGKKWRGRRQRVLQDDVDAGDAIVLDDTDLVEYKEKGN
jgi:phage/plasmid-associated DNA primase